GWGRLRETFRRRSHRDWADTWVNPASAVRRLLLRLVTAAPGGLGSPSVPTRGDRPSVAGRGADEGGRKPAGSGRGNPSRPRPEVTAPGTEKPPWSAERRPRSRQWGAAREGYRQRLAALHSLALRGSMRGLRRTRRRQEYGR